jgi:TRAP-type C4-dicarboxylate transport system substrate-binding protein
MKKATICFFGILAVLITLVPTVQAETKLRFSNWVPPTHPLTTNAFKVWVKKVSSATKGQVKIGIIPPLGKPPAHFDLARKGVTDIAWGVHGYTIDRFPLEYGSMLPFYSNSAKAASVALWRTYEKYFAKFKAYADVKLLGLDVHGPAMIFTTKKKIRSVADMKNLKIRVGGGIISEIGKNLGVVPFFAPAPKAYEVLSKGVADGIFFPAESIASMKIDKVIKYALKFPGGLYRSSNFLIMNKAKWDGLSKANQMALDSVSGENLARLIGQVWDAADKVGQMAMKKNNIDVHVASGTMLADIKAKLAHLENGWVERANKLGVNGRVALNYYRSQITGG